MMRTAIFVRDLLIALALGWIGVNIEPVREETCSKVKGVDSAAPAMCKGARAASFSVAGFGVEMAAESECVSTVR
jgi:hypothetical protein